MKTHQLNTYEVTLNALEVVLKILESKSRQQADAGACVWITPEGRKICVRLTLEDSEKIPGAIFIGGSCKDVDEKNIL